MTIGQCCDEYKRNVIHYMNQSLSTAQHHEDAEKYFIRTFGDIDLLDITQETFIKWKENMDSRALASSTVRGYIIKMRSVMKYANRRRYIEFDYEEIRLPKRVDMVIDFLEPHEVQKLIDCSKQTRTKLWISLMYGSGLRVSELCNLNISQVRQDSFAIVGKGGKQRLVFIDERSRYYLNRWFYKSKPKNTDYLFTRQGSLRRVRPTDVQVTIRKLVHKAGIPKKVTPHVLRHSYATNLLRNGCNVRHIQVLLGHKSLQSTQIYTHVVDSELMSIARKFHTV